MPLSPIRQLTDTKITGDGLVKAGPTPVYYILLTADSANATLKLFDNLDGANPSEMNIRALANTSVAVDLTTIGPKIMQTALYVKINGASATANIWYG